ncbi:MAG TPA: lysophospholipid acyltransferase family protein [Acidobacteriota bacterium]|nr:lysophospholipid acyltransferase family protein [Acidobacteriota bacterium]
MKLRYQLERFGFWIARLLGRILPRSIFLRMGTAFGSLAYGVDRRHREVAIQNYQTAFPNASRDEAEASIRKSYQFFSHSLFDMLTCFPSFPAERMKLFEYEGVDNLDAAYARKKGVLLFTAHYGAWEMMAMAHGYRKWPLGLMSRRLDNPYLEALLTHLRTSTGNFIIEKREGFRPMLRALKEGKGVAILIDQNVVTDERIFVDFFGKLASTTPALALVKLKTDAAMIPVFSQPLSGDRYRFIYGRPVEVALSGDREADVRAITQACTAVIEEKIREHPEYWLWMHRRWKTRPKEEEGFAAEPAGVVELK